MRRRGRRCRSRRPARSVRCRGQALRATRSSWLGPSPRVVAAVAGSVRQRRTSASSTRLAGVRQHGSRQRREVEGLAAAGSGLALARGQQDQHGARVGSGAAGLWLGSRHAQQSRGQGPFVPRTSVSAEEMRDGDRQDPGGDEGVAGVPGGRRGRCRGGGRGSAAPGPRPDGHRVRDDRPRVVDGPRPGDAHRARRRRLRRPLRHRRRRGVRQPRATRSTWRPTVAARRSTAPTPRSRCTRSRSAREPPRCCPTRCARRCCGRSRSTRPVRAPTWSSSGRW